MASISAALAISLSPFPSTNQKTLFSPSPPRLKAVRLPIRCSSGSSPEELDSESDLESTPPERAPSLLGISTNSWRAGIGTVGFLETGYLTYLKLTNSEAFCPLGGGGCSDVLNSEYSSVFGVPLPLIGMVAYGLVALLSVQQIRKNLLTEVGENDVSLILLGITTSMATASAYFLYLLSTKLVGTSCSYCLMSAILSFSLFFVTLLDIGLEDIRKVLGLQLATASVVVVALSYSYMTATPQLSNASETSLERFETEITNQSSPVAISLAKHLHSIGAKMYGAFWCSHCIEQKQMFGQEAVKILDYVECFPQGFGKGRKMAAICTAAGVEGFPTWIIKDKVLSGEQELSDLAEASGFALKDSLPS